MSELALEAPKGMGVFSPSRTRVRKPRCAHSQNPFAKTPNIQVC